MKKLFLAALVVLCALMLVLPAMAAELQFGTVYNTDTLNLRRQPTQTSTWLGQYNNGDWLTISGSSGNWYYVTGPDGKTGYVSKNFVLVEDASYRMVGIVSNQKASAYLNLRAAPSYGATVVDYYYNGVPCVLLSQTGGWYHVRVDGVDGYFREEYITTQTWAASEAVGTIVTPNNTGLNLRFGPGMDYDALGQYKGGKYVMILQRGNGWWKVSIDGKVGFMKTDFLEEGIRKPYDTGSAVPPVAGVGTAVVSNPKSTQVLNLRQFANTTSRVLGQYRNGTRLTLLSYGAEWCQVQARSGETGYMMTRYLTVESLTGSATMTVKHPQGTFVNLRSQPSTGGAVLTRIPDGAVVTVLAPASNGWVKVSYQGYTGYAVDYFLE